MSKKGFNLLRPQIEPPTVWTKVYDWAVGSARIVVILVELVVVLAFAIRIVIDVQSNNLNEEIKTKESIVLVFQSSELRYLNIQQRTSAYRDNWESTPVFSGIFAEVSSYLPPGGKELTVLINPSSGVFVSGTAPVAEIGVMEENFKNSNTFSRATLDSIEGEGAVIDAAFSLSADIAIQENREFQQIEQIVSKLH